MISLSEDEWALCERYGEYMKANKKPPEDIQRAFNTIWGGIFSHMSCYGRTMVLLACDKSSDSHESEEN